jgi:hypothetical protein
MAMAVGSVVDMVVVGLAVAMAVAGTTEIIHQCCLVPEGRCGALIYIFVPLPWVSRCGVA